MTGWDNNAGAPLCRTPRLLILSLRFRCVIIIWHTIDLSPPRTNGFCRCRCCWGFFSFFFCLRSVSENLLPRQYTVAVYLRNARVEHPLIGIARPLVVFFFFCNISNRKRTLYRTCQMRTYTITSHAAAFPQRRTYIRDLMQTTLAQCSRTLIFQKDFNVWEISENWFCLITW